MKKIPAVLPLCALFGAIILMIIYRASVSEAVTEAIKSCVFGIIPSLFGVTVLSTAISESGTVGSLIRPKRATSDVLTAFILGNFGGYPVGAKLLSDSVRAGRLSPAEAERAMPFCYCSGAAFSSGIIGGLYGSTLSGLTAFLGGVMANLTLFLVSLRGFKGSISEAQKPRGFSSALMCESVRSAAGSMFNVSAMIVFFAAIKAVLFAVAPNLKELTMLSPILEITSVTALKGLLLPVCGMLLSFGGFCVLMQIVSIVGGAFSLRRFFISRLLAIPLSGLFTLFLARLGRYLGLLSDVSTKIRLSRSPSLIPIICVLAMVLITVRESFTRRSF